MLLPIRKKKTSHTFLFFAGGESRTEKGTGGSFPCRGGSIPLICEKRTKRKENALPLMHCFGGGGRPDPFSLKVEGKEKKQKKKRLYSSTLISPRKPSPHGK